MRFEFKPSFESSLKTLTGKEKDEVKRVALQVIDILVKDRHLHKGVGLKRLRNDFWEVRKGIKTRIIFRWDKDLVEFVLAGNHDDVRRYLKNV